jgi:Fumarate reductase subunit D
MRGLDLWLRRGSGVSRGRGPRNQRCEAGGGWPELTPGGRRRPDDGWAVWGYQKSSAAAGQACTPVVPGRAPAGQGRGEASAGLYCRSAVRRLVGHLCVYCVDRSEVNMTRLYNEAFWWSLFAAGGGVAAMLVSVHIIVNGIWEPLKGISPE